MAELSTLELQTGDNPDAAVIWLHGLGASGHDFEPVVPELRLPENMAVRFVFPHAPAIPVTVNGGYVMPAWYDIFAMDLERKVDHDGLMASVRAVEDLIARERKRGIESRRIVLAGFSQGGAVTLHAALTHPEPLAGLMALSTYFATGDQIELHPANADLPVFVGHGSRDPMVPEVMGRASVEKLEAMGLEPEYHSYAMEHQVCLEEIQDISRWLQKVLD